MNKTELLAILNQFNFMEAGVIYWSGNRFAFNLTNKFEEVGLVYLWVEVSEETSNANVVYVGKAGRTLPIRCAQHEAGFRHSSAGQAHARRLRSGIDQGKNYVVYFRKSEMTTILGECAIPMEYVEELALIRKFRPFLWNAGT